MPSFPKSFVTLHPSTPPHGCVSASILIFPAKDEPLFEKRSRLGSGTPFTHGCVLCFLVIMRFSTQSSSSTCVLFFAIFWFLAQPPCFLLVAWPSFRCAAHATRTTRNTPLYTPTVRKINNTNTTHAHDAAHSSLRRSISPSYRCDVLRLTHIPFISVLRTPGFSSSCFCHLRKWGGERSAGVSRDVVFRLHRLHLPPAKALLPGSPRSPAVRCICATGGTCNGERGGE